MPFSQILAALTLARFMPSGTIRITYFTSPWPWQGTAPSRRASAITIKVVLSNIGLL
jgi:hypothetical protein